MRNRKHLNALKHGAFADAAILPGEDPQEFEELHSALIEEWMPIGPTEEDAVLSIAKGVWRKRRMQKFLEVKLLKAAFDPKHPAYDEAAALRNFGTIIEAAPVIAFEECAGNLSDRKVEYLQQKFPRWKFESTSEWARAIKNEITSVLVPAIERGEPPDEMLLCQSSAVLTEDVFKHELAVEERIDAMIDRAIKRLIQSKAMKQMLDRTSPNGGYEQPKKIQSSKPNGSAKVVDHKAG